MFNNLNKDDIITKSQLFEQIQPDKILGDSFAKTINYQGIHSNFCLDIPEIIEQEKQKQERHEDIAKFTKLAMSDMENFTHDDRVKELFANENIRKEYEDEVLLSLCSDNQFLQDLGFI